MRGKGIRAWIERFKFAWQYASAGKYAMYGRRNNGITMLTLIELRNMQLKGESAIYAFPNGNIYTEKAHQNAMEKLRKELTK